MKRITIATIFGLIMGVICASLMFSSGIIKFSVGMLLFVLLNRTVMGFVIGASGLKVHWAWNGIIMGLVVGWICSFFLFMNIGGMIPVFNFLANGIFGLVIEFFTTKVFKQPSPTLAPANERAVPA